MKMKKTVQALLLCLSICLGYLIAPFQVHAAVTGDIKSDPIILEQKQTQKAAISKDGNVKYFKLIVKETGNVTISLSSDKLKKNATIALFYDEGDIYSDTATAKYNKKTKQVKGSLTSSRLLMPGQYSVVIKTDKVSKDTKFTIKTSFKKYNCDDAEPNNKIEQAQPMTVNAKKQAQTYNMLLSGETNSVDMIDFFTFDLKSAKKITVSASAQGTDRIRVLIKKKTDTGTEVVNSKESEQYFTSNNGKNTFAYTTKDKLPQGTYYVMVWLEDGQKIQVPYTIKAYAS